MKPLRKKVYLAAGYNTTYMGSGRKEFNPEKPMPTMEDYLEEAARGCCSQLKEARFDEGVIGNFMSARFVNQGNLPAFLPSYVPSLKGKPCTSVEGACGSGGLALLSAIRSVLSDLADAVYVVGFEVQNVVKALYVADILAGAGHYSRERKEGHAFFFPGVFSKRAGAYMEAFGKQDTRRGMAKWFENAILNARKNPKAQEYQNTVEDLFKQGLTPPNPDIFVPNFNLYDCSKVSDGASSVGVFSAEGLKKCGIRIEDAIELAGIGGAEGDITREPDDLTELTNTIIASRTALKNANITQEDLSLLELHDCFTITAILALEAIGFASKGRRAQFILEGHASPAGKIPTNLSGGLGGFGHSTGASGVRQMVDLLHQLTGKAANQSKARTPFGMMVSMGGNDKTVSAIVVKGN